MEQLHQAQTIPHIVQVYQPSISNNKIENFQIIHISHPSLQDSQEKITYQQSVSDTLHMPVTNHNNDPHIQLNQNQISIPCQQAHLNLNLQQIQGHITLQSSDMAQSLQMTSHMLMPQPPVFKQHMLLSSEQQQYYGYDYQKEQCVVTKEEPGLTDKKMECKSESAQIEIEIVPSSKRTRSQIPNPEKWACNIRKMKHQRGEAYISRRGKYVPERRVKNTKDCLKTCKYKCNEKINNTDREHIFRAFYSLNANEKRHFLLNTTERNHARHKIMDGQHKRKYSFKYFFLVRAVRYTVCKNFYLGTLAISQKPVYNVHLGKSDMNLPKPDGRGLSEASTHSLPAEVKDRVRKHIMSFKTVESKSIKQFSKKKQYLPPGLSIKKMYTMYYSDCSNENLVPVKESMYRKILKEEFNLHLKKIKSEQQLCCRCKGTIKKKS
ncbi:uncharacterized protein LOC113512869 [Galleria mellonella]|uniref:Uncharacterized protein LOC113512869 n=1 Tax=Galleria mellonella TaxID=7137 RepID=A0A6J1WFL6_GALME|nr:uncharacterized protein LOC113512869 [Galleria mellonella]